MMLAKILAGVLAAVVVTGVGYYYAMPDSSTGCCKGKTSTSGGDSLASTQDMTTCPADAAPCCKLAASQPNSVEALGACIGGMPVSTGNTRSQSMHCCTE